MRCHTSCATAARFPPAPLSSHTCIALPCMCYCIYASPGGPAQAMSDQRHASLADLSHSPCHCCPIKLHSAHVAAHMLLNTLEVPLWPTDKAAAHCIIDSPACSPITRTTPAAAAAIHLSTHLSCCCPMRPLRLPWAPHSHSPPPLPPLLPRHRTEWHLPARCPRHQRTRCAACRSAGSLVLPRGAAGQAAAPAWVRPRAG
mmetsp:Transcript_24573/g.53699  ORF Transcript_24573/g.53699 Transcript_24573/m.53699 type:complete len:201 (-) Transcript_24573:1447-2049(-)